MPPPGPAPIRRKDRTLSAVAHLTVVADTHLSADAPEAVENWEAVLAYVEAQQPDLVVHVGDVSLQGETNPVDLTFARSQLERLGAPFAVVPGNHDVGDIAAFSGEPADMVNETRRAHWIDAFGSDRWEVDLGAWRVVGLNAQLFGSHMSAEHEQWEWLEDRLGGEDDQHRALVVHKPVAASDEEQEASPRYRFIPVEAQAHLAALTKDAPIKVVFSGHVHQSRQFTFAGTLHAWAPTSWAVLPESMQATIGGRRCGLFNVELGDDGNVAVDLLEPAGMTQLMVGQNAPHRYSH
jgi:3',5'-cyclic AMP phosphodiesterase CpdA